MLLLMIAPFTNLFIVNQKLLITYVLCPMAYVCLYSCEHDNDFIKCSEHCQRQAIIWGQQYRSCGDCHLIDWDNEEPPLGLWNRRPDLIRIMQYTLVMMSCWLTFTSALITATDPISQAIIIFHCTILVWLGERFVSLDQWLVKKPRPGLNGCQFTRNKFKCIRLGSISTSHALTQLLL